MREIQAELLTNTVAQMCIRANYDLPRDVLRQLQSAQAAEPWPAAQEILRQILENAELAAANAQRTGGTYRGRPQVRRAGGRAKRLRGGLAAQVRRARPV